VGGVDDRPLMQRAIDASVRPLNLLAPGVGVAAAGGLLALGFPPLAIAAGAMSLATWGALVAWDLSAAPAAEPSRKPFATPQLERAYSAIAAAADRVRAAIDAHDGVLSSSLVELRASCDELVDGAARMAARADAIAAFLRTHDPQQMERGIEETLRNARQVRDPTARDSLLAAADAKRRQLASLGELHTLFDRILAELVGIEAALGELHARVVKLTFDDPERALDVGVGDELRTVQERVRVLEQSAAATLRELE
jgi:hypothetical protein